MDHGQFQVGGGIVKGDAAVFHKKQDEQATAISISGAAPLGHMPPEA